MRNKPRMISLRLSDSQYQTIQDLIKLIDVRTGTKVSQSSMVLKLIELGKPLLEERYTDAVTIARTGEDEPRVRTGIFRFFR